MVFISLLARSCFDMQIHKYHNTYRVCFWHKKDKFVINKLLQTDSTEMQSLFDYAKAHHGMRWRALRKHQTTAVLFLGWLWNVWKWVAAWTLAQAQALLRECKRIAVFPLSLGSQKNPFYCCQSEPNFSRRRFKYSFTFLITALEISLVQTMSCLLVHKSSSKQTL